jgi:hypothetical protein
MSIKLRFAEEKENKKKFVVVRDEIQAAAFLKAGFEPATAADEAKLKGEEVKEEQE